MSKPWTTISSGATGIEALLRLRRNPHLGPQSLEDSVPVRQEAIATFKAIPVAKRYGELLTELAKQEQAVTESAIRHGRREASVEEVMLRGGDLKAATTSRDKAKTELDAAVGYRDELHAAAAQLRKNLEAEHRTADDELRTTIGGLGIGEKKRLWEEIPARISDLLDQLARAHDIYDRGRNFGLPSVDELFGTLPAKRDVAIPETAGSTT